MVVLNLNSPRTHMPPNCKIVLKEHQSALLYHCMNLEKQYPFLVMNDRVGSGKSFVVLACLMWDKHSNLNTNNHSISLLVVPHVIFSQWQSYIEQFFERGTFKYKSFIEYDDICNLYHNEKQDLLQQDLLITTSTYYPSIAQVLETQGIVLNRLIIDEIDSMEFLLPNTREKDAKFKTQEKTKSILPAKKNWFISASFDIDKIGIYKDLINERNLTLNAITVSCEPSFIDSCIQIPHAVEYTYKCQDFMVPQLHSILHNKEFDGYDFPTSAEAYYKKFSLDLLNKIHILESGIKETRKEQQRNELQTQLSKNLTIFKQFTQSIPNQHCSICLSTDHLLDMNCCHSIFCQECLIKFPRRLCPLCRIPSICKPSQPPNLSSHNASIFFPMKFEDIQLKPKLETLVHILNLIPEPKSVLIFSDYSNTFKHIQRIVGDEGYTVNSLNAGNLKDMSDQITAFKQGYTQVLCVDTHINSTGVNFEHATDVILLHKTSQEMQCIGRAQRMNRKEPLRIHRLMYEYE